MFQSKNDFLIRPASRQNAHSLTRVANASKRHWHYPDHYYEIWKDELTITPDYIAENTVYVLEENKNIIAFYSLVTLTKDLRFKSDILEKGTWLDHMFIAPDHIGRGMGRFLFDHLYRWCRSRDIFQVRLLADPYAAGFYRKMGCKYVRQVPSTIPGRTTPLYEITVY